MSDKKRRTFMLTRSTSEQLDAYAEETGSTMSEVVENALRRHLRGDQLSEMDAKLDRILSAIGTDRGDPPTPPWNDGGRGKRELGDNKIREDGSESTAIESSDSGSSSSPGSGSKLPAAPSPSGGSDSAELDIDQLIATGELSGLELPPGETLTNQQLKRIAELIDEQRFNPAWVDTSSPPRSKANQAAVIAGIMRYDRERDDKRPEAAIVDRDDIKPYISELVGSTDYVVETTMNALTEHELIRDRWHSEATVDDPDGKPIDHDRWFLYREGFSAVRLNAAADPIRMTADYSGGSLSAMSFTRALGLIDIFGDDLIAEGYFDESELSRLGAQIRNRRVHIHAIAEHVRSATSYGDSTATRESVIEAVPSDHTELETADVLDALISAGVFADRNGRIVFTDRDAWLEVC